MKEKEHQSIEWKESWQDEYLKWICGYANAYGGTIYIGTDDAGNVVGIDNARDFFQWKHLSIFLIICFGTSFLFDVPAHTILPIGFMPAVLKNSSILRIAPLL